MAFIDELTIHARAGRGGDGVVRWLHLKGKEYSGPSGGNGGRGGSVYFRAVRDINVLARYTGTKEFVAERGENGQKNSRHGRSGADIVIDVPVGSLIKRADTGETWDLSEEGRQILALRGGGGGLGNEHFKSSTNVVPEESTSGKPGDEGDFFIELRLIVDAGLIGLPNAGKSSLMNALTGSRAKVGDYPFTTLDPNLGVLYGYILADIPGLIEGASEGRGLGHKFLRHIARTKMLLHCISLEHEDPVAAYRTIRQELGAHDATLLTRPEVIILTKADAVDESTRVRHEEAVHGLSGAIIVTSVLDDALIKRTSEAIVAYLARAKGQAVS